ncbi:MAG TPA: Gfo/Idh/MocA family oxidoreductase, partial [Candidatus Hydrogenedentes bacterium]|nr:Gfo/Idh/MocA family oxidoreductase [Candidatus Hydrogenedentota bacterium]
MTHYSRRNFLQQSSMALAASALGGAAGAFAAAENKPVSANDKILIGAIGCGGMGRGDIDTFLRNPEVECPIVCDIDDKMTAEAARLVEGRRGRAPEIVKDFRRVIERNDLDAVLVATPDHWHALPTVYACQAGKDVYCEKPLGKTIDEGRAMVEAAKDNKRVVQMGTQWRSG